jgi:hypothetical protein
MRIQFSQADGALDEGAKSMHAARAPAKFTAALTAEPSVPNAPVTTTFFPDKFTVRASNPKFRPIGA